MILFLIAVVVITISIVGTYYRQMDKRGRPYNQLGPALLLAIVVAVLIYLYTTTP